MAFGPFHGEGSSGSGLPDPTAANNLLLSSEATWAQTPLDTIVAAVIADFLDEDGYVPPAILGSGSDISTKFLRGDKTWQTIEGGSGVPGGSSGQLQFNDGGAFGGAAGLTWAAVPKRLALNTTGNSAGYDYPGGPSLEDDSDNAGGPSLMFRKSRLTDGVDQYDELGKIMWAPRVPVSGQGAPYGRNPHVVEVGVRAMNPYDANICPMLYVAMGDGDQTGVFEDTFAKPLRLGVFSNGQIFMGRADDIAYAKTIYSDTDMGLIHIHNGDAGNYWPLLGLRQVGSQPIIKMLHSGDAAALIQCWEEGTPNVKKFEVPATGIIAPAYLGSGSPGISNFLRGDGSWAAPSVGAAGSDTQVQFNDGGALAGATFYWNKTTKRLGINVAPLVAFDSYEDAALGTTAGNYQRISRIAGKYGASGSFYKHLFLYRDTNGSDWTTIRLHDALGVDGTGGTPRTDTMCWWERDAYDTFHAWGNGANEWMRLGSAGLWVGAQEASQAALAGLLRVRQSTEAGTTAGNHSIISREFTANIGRSLHSVRKTGGASWTTLCLQDSVFVGTTWADAAGRLWWERHPNDAYQAWGDLTNEWMRLTSGGLKISGFGLGLTPITQRSHVIDPSGGGTVDAEARTAINAMLATLEAFGFHAAA